jgi:hypothetical protein
MLSVVVEAIAFQTKNLNQLLLSMTLKSQDLVKHLNDEGDMPKGADHSIIANSTERKLLQNGSRSKRIT